MLNNILKDICEYNKNKLIFSLTEEEEIQVTNYKVEPIFNSEIITLTDLNRCRCKEVFDYILNNYNFTLGEDNNWVTIIDNNEIIKLSILENYPEYIRQMIYNIGEDWLEYYYYFEEVL